MKTYEFRFSWADGGAAIRDMARELATYSNQTVGVWLTDWYGEYEAGSGNIIREEDVL